MGIVWVLHGGCFGRSRMNGQSNCTRCRLRDFLGPTHLLYWAHVAKGLYAMQLERWFSLLGRDNVKVMSVVPSLHMRRACSSCTVDQGTL